MTVFQLRTVAMTFDRFSGRGGSFVRRRPSGKYMYNSRLPIRISSGA
ncbi:hypothetical protein [Sphaerisporangium perillae]|nr:hypothetical protein [Sphaerisporangium perillae]